MPGRSWSSALPPLTEDERALAAELRSTVDRLCERGPRNLDHPEALARAADLVQELLEGPTQLPVWRESYAARPFGIDSHNLVLDLPGTRAPREIVVIGAHYDSAGDAPGANDDASGVAALCALARRFAERGSERTLRFVAFANEEPPYFETEAMGSRVHARRASERGDRIVAMLALETLGCYSDAEGSQRYPIQLLALAYPSRGDFVAFVGNLGSRALVRECVGAFRAAASFPSEGAALPEPIPGVGWSDHASFWPYDVPAVMVTDTAVFRDPHYHERSDTPEKLDYERFARVVLGLEPVLTGLATR
ncbi:MAG: M20/M25/M40 family metallo-hydrolase [Planctomycetes bacterium]|nr:M20/M25/M40 family metallo-hydrolase [Planctomycetota bacterium]